MSARHVFIALGPLLALSTVAAAQQTRLGASGTNLLNYRGQVGKRVSLVCPPQQPAAGVYGTDTYTDDSPICTAAVHAGAITADKGGLVTVVIGGPEPRFVGSTRNGITSQEFAAWPGSYTFDRTAGVAEVDWSTTANGLEGFSGTITVQCPAGGTPKQVWGTDVYTSDSSICGAATHAGLITPASGGMVALKVSPGRASYTGSERNGVTSVGYGSWGSSIELSKPVFTATRARAVPAERAPTVGAVAPTTTAATSARTQAVARENPRVPTITAPTNVAATYLSGGNIAVAWDSVPGATSYDVLATTPSNNAAFGISEQPAAKPYVVSRALSPDTYSISVRANGEAGTSPQSKAVTVTVPRWYGKYRVTINGIKVNRETLDNPAEIDGKRDEIYIKAKSRVFHSVGVALTPEVTIKSLTHGDINAARWQNQSNLRFRIQAGSASQMGGLKTGDAAPNPLMPWKRDPSATEGTRTFPLLVWEGELYQDMNSVVIIPSIWEDDEMPTPAELESNYFPALELATTPIQQAGIKKVGEWSVTVAQTMLLFAQPSFANTLALRDHVSARQQALPPNPLVTDLVDRFRPMLTNISNRVGSMLATVALMSNSRDRPVGLKPQGGNPTFDPAVVMLNYDQAEKVIAGNANGSLEPGILRLDYKDTVGGGQGDYTLFLEVRRR